LDVAEGGSARVLIVEDNPANLLLTRAVLQRAGYRTAEARSAEEVLERLQTAPPHLILMDVQLPGQDGLSLTRQLKADPSTAAIPIVALTAHAMSDDRARAQAAGCDGYIAKPINTRTFADEVAYLIRNRPVAVTAEGTS
jgi:two-component system cell cycle response regulator DivK